MTFEQLIDEGAATTTAAEAQDVRVVVVDRYRERRGVMRQLLERAYEPAEIADAADREETLELLARWHPLVVVLEIQMPVAEGLETISALRAASPLVKIVVCSFHRDGATIQSALDRGADAYLTKPMSNSEFRAATGPRTRSVEDLIAPA